MKQHRARAKRKQILDALKRCLDREAYSYISLQTVADEAGVSKGGLRYHFPDKEALFIGLIQDFASEIEKEHLSAISGLDMDRDKALVSTLYGIERFVLDKRNIKVFINLLLYGLEEKRIMKLMREFFRNHLMVYQNIVTRAKEHMPHIDREEFDLRFKARIAQMIFLSAGLMEEVDPIEMDPSMLTRYVISLFE